MSENEPMTDEQEQEERNGLLKTIGDVALVLTRRQIEVILGIKARHQKELDETDNEGVPMVKIDKRRKGQNLLR